jgi:DNA polymerase-3 subunit delta'
VSSTANTVSDEIITGSALPWQLPLVDRLVELKRDGKLPHALLVELRTSVSSEAFGWYLVNALICDDDASNEPCGQCKPCNLMMANNHPDVSFTTLQENDKSHKLNKDIKIDQIRSLIHQISLTDSLQGGKFALVYPAEKMNQAAANSLLKTLEEPSDKSTLILLTHHSSRLPVTIRSRCQSWVVQAPDIDQARDWLKGNLPGNDANRYLELAGNDPQLAAQLAAEGYADSVESFRNSLAQVMRGELDVATMVNAIKDPQPVRIRHLVLDGIAREVKKITATPVDRDSKQRLAALLDLRQYSQRTLQTEDNNLNLLLQLEDVLISLKRIINWS